MEKHELGPIREMVRKLERNAVAATPNVPMTERTAAAQAIEEIKAKHRDAAPKLSAELRTLLRDRVVALGIKEEAVPEIEAIVALALVMRGERKNAARTLSTRAYLAKTRVALTRASEAWAGLDPAGRFRIVQKICSQLGEVSPDRIIEATRLVEFFFFALIWSTARAEKEVRTRRGAPTVPEEAMFLVQELGRVWVRFGPRGRKGPPAVTNSRKAGGFTDFAIAALAGLDFGFTQAQLETAVRRHVAALRRTAAPAAGKRAG